MQDMALEEEWLSQILGKSTKKSYAKGMHRSMNEEKEGELFVAFSFELYESHQKRCNQHGCDRHYRELWDDGGSGDFYRMREGVVVGEVK